MEKNKRKKNIIFVMIYVVMLLAQIYTHFIFEFTYETSAYRNISIAGFILYCLAGLVYLILLIFKNINRQKTVKIIIIVMLVVQVVSLLGVNLHAGTFPIISARGSVYQYGILDPEVSSSQMLLFLSYYLDGKTLYATPKDDPRLFEAAELFFEDEYTFVAKTTKVLTYEERKYFLEEERENYYTLTVLPNYKLGTKGIFVTVYSADDLYKYDEFMLYKDYYHNWYIIPKELRGDKWQLH